jgi:hypothetical protein
MVGSWSGNGFNTIFRPQSKVTPTPLPKKPDPATNPADNVLELNLTSEHTTFTPIPGLIPNRGELDDQGDINLTGMLYLQNISDITTSPPTGIHIEPGVWIVIPKTTDPLQPETTVTRMGSIPHGTTINAQGTTAMHDGPPIIPQLDPGSKPPLPTSRITPFDVDSGESVGPGTFPSQTAANPATFRIPQDLSAFIAAGTITQDILDDPNTVLRNIVAKQTILRHTQVSISTSTNPPAIIAGGGLANIAFLANTGPADADNQIGDNGPNALGAKMSATFWLSTVEKEVTLPRWEHGSPPIHVPLVGGLPAHITPMLTIDPGRDIPAPTKVRLTFTQIQYSQLVLLDFNTLSWPHVSVATLVPSVLTVPPSAFGG